MSNSVAELMARLKAARQRAKYWSGCPTGRPGAAYAMSAQAIARLAARGSDHELEYEQALDDCNALADAIQQLTGKRPQVTDFKQKFGERFNAGFGAALNTRSARESCNGKD